MKTKNKEKKDYLIESILDINKVIHEPVRLFIMSILYSVEEVDFLFLLSETSISKGNIATHLKKLEENGYINSKKEILEKKTHTSYKITELGKKSFENYCYNMQSVLNSLSIN